MNKVLNVPPNVRLGFDSDDDRYEIVKSKVTIKRKIEDKQLRVYENCIEENKAHLNICFELLISYLFSSTQVSLLIFFLLYLSPIF